MSENWISMLEASKRCSYSQEYLSLLARRGKILAQKIGRNWYTTGDALNDYLKKQSLTITVPRNVIGRLTSSSLTPEEPEKGEEIGTGHEGHSKIFEEFERLNPQLFETKKTEGQFQIKTESVSDEKKKFSDDMPSAAVLNKLDKLSDSLENFAEQVTRKISEPVSVQALTPEQQDFISIESQSRSFRFKKFDRYARSLMSNPTSMMAVMITALVAIFLLAGGFSFGQADYVIQQIHNAFKDADTLQGHFPGTHANEVLVLDKAGNISIFGHVETEGQLRSRAPDGVAPIVVDSITKVENLNADLLDGLDSKELTLAFVTKNGNLTTEDVFLEGNVEVGKTLTVKGAFKLLDSLDVYGRLGVFGEAVFGKNITLTGGDLVLEKGTIKIFNTNLVKNLNAEYLDGVRKNNIDLEFVTSNGATTNYLSFFNSGIWGKTGSFGSVGADVISANKDLVVGKQNSPGEGTFRVYTSQFTFDENGNATIGGNLVVQDYVRSNLIASGSYDLGSSASPWNRIFASSVSFSNLTVTGTGGGNFEGTTSSSFRINTDNSTVDAEDSYLSFERGTTTPNALIKWDSINKQFNFNQPVKISSTSFELVGTASISGDLILNGSGAASGRLQLSRAPTIAHTGTWPSFSGLDDATLLINPPTSVADGNLIAITVGGAAKFVVDNEGDVYAAGNLVLSGTTTQSTTDILENLTVAGNTRLGDSLTDKINMVGTVLPNTLSTTSILNVQASPSWSGDYYLNIINSSSVPIFRVASSGYAEIGSTASASLIFLPLSGNSQNKFTIRAGSSSGSGGERIEFLNGSNESLVTIASNGFVGIGTTTPAAPLQVSGASTPTIGVLDTTNGASGIFRAGDTLISLGTVTANSLLLITNSVTRLTIDSIGNVSMANSASVSTNFEVDGIASIGGNTYVAGNVGIGTTSPSDKLHIVGNAGSNQLRVNDNGNGFSLYFGQFGGASQIGFSGTSLQIKSGVTEGSGPATTGNTKWTIDSNGNITQSGNLIVEGTGNSSIAGNVGIGTTTPSGQFEVVASTALDDYFLRLTAEDGTSGAILTVASTGYVGIGTTTPGAKLQIAAVDDSVAPVLSFRQGNSLTYGYDWDHDTLVNGDLSLMRVLDNVRSQVLTVQRSTGNVGIGTISPNTNLGIYNANESTTLTNFTQALTNAGVNIVTDYTDGAYTPGIFWSTQNNNGTKPKAGIWMLTDSSGSDLYFGTSNGYATGITNSGMILDQSGSLSIATSLDVGSSAQFGSGNVALIDSTGKITGLSSTYFNADTSANLASILSDETGTAGGFVRATGPTVTTLTVSTGGIAVTGNSTISGTLGGITTLTATTLSGDLSCTGCVGTTEIGTNGVGQDEIAASAVGTGELKTGTGTFSSTVTDTTIEMTNEYTFFPNVELDDCSGPTDAGNPNWGGYSGNATDDQIGRLGLVLTGGPAACTSGSYDVRWRYVTASDRPTIWILQENGKTISVWQAEDPPHQNYPENPNPFVADMTGARIAISVAPLSVSQIDALYNFLPENDRIKIFSKLAEYVVKERGWLNSLSSVYELSNIAERYEPAGRFWAMRFISDHYDISLSDLIMETMQTNGDTLELKPSFSQTLANYLAQREVTITENKAKLAELAALPENQQSADIAEFYQSSQTFESGDIVSVGLNGLAKSSGSYDSKVISIVSTAPGQVLGRQITENDIKLAIAGRVPVKVSLQNGPILPGDRLTTSSTPGVAMKATKAGMTVGIALEEQASEGGKVLTFVNLGYWSPSVAEVTVGTVEQVSVSSNGGISLTDLAEEVLVRVQNIWITGDMIAEGIKKTYHSVSSIKNQLLSIGDWTTREITIAVVAPEEVKTLFGGPLAQAADQSKIDLVENGAYLATYGVDSTKGEIQLSGSSQIVNGEAQVFFDYSFSSIISLGEPIRVIITPTVSLQGQLYVATKTQFGFVVKELNGASSGTFDWLVIARRQGFEDSTVLPTPEPTPLETPASTPEPTPELTPDPSTSPSPTPEPIPKPTQEITPTPTPESPPLELMPSPAPEQL